MIFAKWKKAAELLNRALEKECTKTTYYKKQCEMLRRENAQLYNENNALKAARGNSGRYWEDDGR